MIKVQNVIYKCIKDLIKNMNDKLNCVFANHYP